MGREVLGEVTADGGFVAGPFGMQGAWYTLSSATANDMKVDLSTAVRGGLLCAVGVLDANIPGPAPSITKLMEEGLNGEHMIRP